MANEPTDSDRTGTRPHITGPDDPIGQSIEDALEHEDWRGLAALCSTLRRDAARWRAVAEERGQMIEDMKKLMAWHDAGPKEWLA